MERFTQIINNTVFLAHLRAIEELESDRIFCRHNYTHFFDVARIAMLINVEEDYKIDKDMIYAAALLHDVGRDVEYTSGLRHELASAQICVDILKSTGYDEEQIEEIAMAIQNHRNKDIKDEKSLSGLIYRADKLSRACYLCNAYDRCSKAYDKRNEVPIW